MTASGLSGAVLRLLLDQVASFSCSPTNLLCFYLVPFVLTPIVFSLVLQFVFAPVFVGVFLSAVVTLEGKPSNVIPKLKQVWIIKSIFFFRNPKFLYFVLFYRRSD